MKDKHSRSITKALFYRGMGIVVLATVSWITTRSLIEVTSITIGYHLVSLCGYYIYERIWERIEWGKSKGG